MLTYQPNKGPIGVGLKLLKSSSHLTNPDQHRPHLVFVKIDLVVENPPILHVTGLPAPAGPEAVIDRGIDRVNVIVAKKNENDTVAVVVDRQRGRKVKRRKRKEIDRGADHQGLVEKNLRKNLRNNKIDLFSK